MAQHPWLATTAQDEADAPPWAEEIPAQFVREQSDDGVPGPTICAQVSRGVRPPQLIRTHPTRWPKKPMYLISADLWAELCDKYGMTPDDQYIGSTFIARDYRNKLGHFALWAHRDGLHTPVQSRNGWDVWFVPRLWLEEGMKKKLAAERRAASRTAAKKAKADADVEYSDADA